MLVNGNKDKIKIREIRTLSETEEEDYYKLVRINNAFDNMKVMVIKAKRCQLKNILIRLDHIWVI